MTAKSLRLPAFFFTSLIVALTLAACGNASSGSAKSGTTTTGGTTTTTSACTKGTASVNGVNTIKFCGPAKGSVTVSGQTYAITEGECFNTQGQFGVNIGHEVLDGANSDAGNALKKQYDYFGALAQASKDGTYPSALLAGYAHGVDFSATGTMTLSNNLQAGSFTGTTILSKAAVTGTFTCS